MLSVLLNNRRIMETSAWAQEHVLKLLSVNTVSCCFKMQVSVCIIKKQALEMSVSLLVSCQYLDMG